MRITEPDSPETFRNLKIDIRYEDVGGVSVADCAHLDELIHGCLEEISTRVDAFASLVDEITFRVKFTHASEEFFPIKCSIKVGIGQSLTLNFSGNSLHPRIAFEKALAKMRITIGNDWSVSHTDHPSEKEPELKRAG